MEEPQKLFIPLYFQVFVVQIVSNIFTFETFFCAVLSHIQ